MPDPAGQALDNPPTSQTAGVPADASATDPMIPARSFARLIASALWIALPLALAALALGYLWPQSDIRDAKWHELLSFAAFMVRTFLFQGGIAAACAAVLALIIRRRMLAVAWALVAIPLLGPELRYYLPSKPPPIRGETVRVMSVNLLRSALRPDDMLTEILGADADVLCLQEYSNRWDARIGAALRRRYPFVSITPREDSFGVALCSKRPFLTPVIDDIGIGTWGLPQQRTQIEIDGQRVNVFNIHIPPPSPRFRPTRGDSHALEQRRCWEDLRTLLARVDGPTLICGDFNATLRSHIGAGMSALGFLDAHEIAGYGRGSTWPADGNIRQYLPGVRIDHIFLRGLTAGASRVGVGPGSDHHPIAAEIGFPQ
ncbi:MAG: endonuclease/exonuclease/phosphatase family protein [Phycisphaerales bacterium]|nr:endonuclease/exonuclease/phosphatase family protein [Phycisphaerales bacterium]